LKEGPCTLRFEPDGGMTYLHWDPALGPANGTWTVAEDRLCINSDRRCCYVAVANCQFTALLTQFQRRTILRFP
jgi:hypothetical protein